MGTGSPGKPQGYPCQSLLSMEGRNYQTYNFRDMEITLSYTLLQQETTYYSKSRTAEIEEASTETRKTFYTTSKNSTFPINPSSQHVSPKDQIPPHFQNLLDS